MKENAPPCIAEMTICCAWYALILLQSMVAAHLPILLKFARVGPLVQRARLRHMLLCCLRRNEALPCLHISDNTGKHTHTTSHMDMD